MPLAEFGGVVHREILYNNQSTLSGGELNGGEVAKWSSNERSSTRPFLNDTVTVLFFFLCSSSSEKVFEPSALTYVIVSAWGREAVRRYLNLVLNLPLQ